MTKIKKNISDKKYYDWFDKKSNLDNVELYKSIKTFIYKKFKKPIIFDIGCGQGIICNYLNGIGFDSNKYAINLAKRHYINDKFYHVNALDINLKSFNLKRADVIVCQNLIEHLNDKDKDIFMKKVLPSILKENGYIIFSLYKQFFLPNIVNMIIKRGSLFDPTHIHNWNETSFKREVSKYFKIAYFNNVAGYTALTWITKYIKTETLIIARFKK